MLTNTTQERRRSWNSLSTNDTWRPRSASTGVLEMSPYSRSLVNSQKAPATPCFVSPRMAFSTQFNYDSPIQVLTSSSPCVFQPKSMKELRRRCSLKNLSPRCKILLILVSLVLSLSLFVMRTSREDSTDSTMSCTDGSCTDATHDHPSSQRFFSSVSQLPSYHTLSEDLDNPFIDMPNSPSHYENPHSMAQGWSAGDHGFMTAQPPVETFVKPMYFPNRAARISGVYIEEETTSAPTKPDNEKGIEDGTRENSEQKYPKHSTESAEVVVEREKRETSESDNSNFQKEESSSSKTIHEHFNFASSEGITKDDNLGPYPRIFSPNVNYDLHAQRPTESLLHPQFATLDGNYILAANRPEGYQHFQHPEYIQPFSDGRNQHPLSGRDIEARMIRHSLPTEQRSEGSQNTDFDRMHHQGQMPLGYINGGAPMAGGAPYLRNEEPPVERYPPGVNPMRYRNEF